MKKTILIVFLSISLKTYSQSEWVKVGSKWWYSSDVSYLESYLLGYNTKIGFIKYEYLKDTLIGSESYGYIKTEKHSYDGSVAIQTPILTRQKNRIIEYKFLSDTQWCYFNHLQPIENQTFTGYIRDCDQNRLFNISITGINTFTVNGISIDYYYLNFIYGNDIYGNENVQYSLLRYQNIGGMLSFYPLINCAVADGPPESEIPAFGPLRCFEKSDVLFKFQIDRYSYIGPDLNGNPAFSCDSIRNATPTGLEESINSHEIELYPNPVSDNLIIELKNNFLQINSVQIYSMEGKLVYQSLNPYLNTSIPISAYKPGIYVLLISSKNKKQVYRFLKV